MNRSQICFQIQLAPLQHGTAVLLAASSAATAADDDAESAARQCTAGAYTRSIFSSTGAVSYTQYTLNTP